MKNLLIISLLCLLSISAFAQRERPNHYDREKLEAAKIAFITQRLDIKPEQATAFWPLYNEFDKSRFKLHLELRAISRKKTEDLTQDKARELIESRFKLQQELLNLEKAFTSKISDILTPVQTYQLSEVDREFIRHLYRKNREMRSSKDDRQ